MKHRIFAAALVALTFSGPALAADDTARQITVTGEGRVEAEPDMAVITLGVTHESEAAKEAMDQTSASVATILQRLDRLGISPRDLQTQQLSLNPVWSNRPISSDGERRITGFVASNMVMVRVRDLNALGLILDAVMEDGANQFNGLQFGMQDPDPLTDEARRRAVSDAIAKASLLAEAAGVTLGPVQSISEAGARGPVMMEMAAAARGGGVPVAPGEVTLSANVSMVFEIADN
ncbi:SIMPL domain-containing protein [Arenibacterium sp. CAU 1754]